MSKPTAPKTLYVIVYAGPGSAFPSINVPRNTFIRRKLAKKVLERRYPDAADRVGYSIVKYTR